MPRLLERIKAGERVEHYETQRRRKDGRSIPISLSVSPIFDENGRIVGATKISRDISSERRCAPTSRSAKDFCDQFSKPFPTR